jgi:hypothetical protein
VGDIEELLDTVDKSLERVKTLYEQYFLGIQKQAPQFLHTDIERKLRDLTQLQIRNTGLRYRLATLQQKFGAYNSYWKRTLRQIENGTYLRNLSKIGRDAVRSGAEIPEEILAAMPKRMREQVVRDREAALAIAKRRKLDGEPVAADHDEITGASSEPTELRRQLKTPGGAHVIDESDTDFEAMFRALESKPVEVPRSAAGASPRTSGSAATPAAPAASQRDAVPTPIGSQPSRPVVKPPPIPVKSTGAYPAAAAPAPSPLPTVRLSTGQYPTVKPGATAPTPATAPSQTTRANPIGPNAAGARGDVPANQPPVPNRPPAGMTEADVNALYAKYVQAKQMVGEATGPREREKLLRTIHAQAPKIIEQYKAKGVDFTVVVKDKQVIIRAKPKP